MDGILQLPKQFFKNKSLNITSDIGNSPFFFWKKIPSLF